jgi:hypothetical protein
MGTETTPTHSWRLVTRCLLLKLRPSEKLVLQALAFHYPRVFPSIERIAALAGVSRATAKRALRTLVGKGYVSKRWRQKHTTVYDLKVDRILMQADKREKSLAQNGPAGRRKQAQNEPVAQFEPGQDDPPTDNIISTDEDIESTNHASKELDNEPQELDAGIEIESDDHPDPASSGDLRVDAQSALRPNCASSRPEVGGVKDHGMGADLRIPADYAHACQQELDTTASPLSAGLSDVSNTTASPGGWVDDGIIADDPGEDAEDNAIEIRECAKSKLTLPASEFPAQEAGRPAELSPWCKTILPAHLRGEADLGDEPQPAVAAPRQAMLAPVSSEPDQRKSAPAPKPEPKPACKYGISQGPVCWFIEDKDGKTVARAPTMEQAILTALQMNGTPHDRFLASKSDGVCRVFDTRGGVAKVVKTCATTGEAREEAVRLSKESQQPRSLKLAA